jgi:hypothetical protein
MRIIGTVAALSAAMMAFTAPLGHAQVSEDGMGKILPVELYVCQFNEGKGPAELNAVVDQWNAFMDERKLSYAAWLLTPYYYGMDQAFDVIWMGASPDGNAMGAGTHAYVTEGGEIAAAFAGVMDCPVHVGLASAMYKAPPRGSNTSEMSVIAMQDCEMNEGTRYSDVRSAELAWAEHLGEQKVNTAVWHWFPTFGGGDQDYDYKLVYAYENLKEMGTDWEMRANGGGRAKEREIFGDLDDCNDARVYVARSIRAAKLR